MKIIAITSKFGFSFIALGIYLLLFTIFTEPASVSMGVIFYLFFGLLFGWKGALILPVVSIIVDEFILDRILRNLGDWVRVWICIFVYGFLGMIIAYTLYGNEPFFMASGAITSVIFTILVQAFMGINKYQQRKFDEMYRDEKVVDEE